MRINILQQKSLQSCLLARLQTGLLTAREDGSITIPLIKLTKMVVGATQLEFSLMMVMQEPIEAGVPSECSKQSNRLAGQPSAMLASIKKTSNLTFRYHLVNSQMWMAIN